MGLRDLRHRRLANRASARRTDEARADQHADGHQAGPTSLLLALAQAAPALFRREQERISKGITHVRQRLAVTDREFGQIAKHLAAALDLATNVQDAYANAPNPIRRRLNQSLFKTLRVEENGEVVGELAPPFDTILSPEAKRLASTRAAQKAMEASEADWSAWEATWNANGAQETPLSAVGLNNELMVVLTGHLSNPPEPLARLLELSNPRM